MADVEQAVVEKVEEVTKSCGEGAEPTKCAAAEVSENGVDQPTEKGDETVKEACCNGTSDEKEDVPEKEDETKSAQKRKPDDNNEPVEGEEEAKKSKAAETEAPETEAPETEAPAETPADAVTETKEKSVEDAVATEAAPTEA